MIPYYVNQRPPPSRLFSPPPLHHSLHPFKRTIPLGMFVTDSCQTVAVHARLSLSLSGCFSPHQSGTIPTNTAVVSSVIFYPHQSVLHHQAVFVSTTSLFIGFVSRVSVPAPFPSAVVFRLSPIPFI